MYIAASEQCSVQLEIECTLIVMSHHRDCVHCRMSQHCSVLQDISLLLIINKKRKRRKKRQKNWQGCVWGGGYVSL